MVFFWFDWNIKPNKRRDRNHSRRWLRFQSGQSANGQSIDMESNLWPSGTSPKHAYDCECIGIGSTDTVKKTFCVRKLVRKETNTDDILTKRLEDDNWGEEREQHVKGVSCVKQRKSSFIGCEKKKTSMTKVQKEKLSRIPEQTRKRHLWTTNDVIKITSTSSRWRLWRHNKSPTVKLRA